MNNGLVAHCQLAQTAQDLSGNNNHARLYNVTLNDQQIEELAK